MIKIERDLTLLHLMIRQDRLCSVALSSNDDIIPSELVSRESKPSVAKSTLALAL